MESLRYSFVFLGMVAFSAAALASSDLPGFQPISGTSPVLGAAGKSPPSPTCLATISGHNKKNPRKLFESDGDRLDPDHGIWSMRYFDQPPRIPFFRSFSVPEAITSSGPLFVSVATATMQTVATNLIKDPKVQAHVVTMIREAQQKIMTMRTDTSINSPLAARFFLIEVGDQTVRMTYSLSHMAAQISFIVIPKNGRAGFNEIEEFHAHLAGFGSVEDGNLKVAHVIRQQSPIYKGDSRIVNNADGLGEALGRPEAFRTYTFNKDQQAAAIEHLGKFFKGETSAKTIVIVPVNSSGQGQFAVGRIRNELGSMSDIIMLPPEIITAIKASGVFKGVERSQLFRKMEAHVTLATLDPDRSLALADISSEYRIQNPTRPKDRWPLAMSAAVAHSPTHNFGLPPFAKTTEALFDMDPADLMRPDDSPPPADEPPPAPAVATADESSTQTADAPAPKVTTSDPALVARNEELSASVEALTKKAGDLEREKNELAAELAKLRESFRLDSENLALELAASQVAERNAQILRMETEHAELGRQIESLRMQVRGLKAHKQGLTVEEIMELRKLTPYGAPETMRDTLRYHEILANGRLIIHDRASHLAQHSKFGTNTEVVREIYAGIRTIYEDVIPVLEQLKGGLQGAEEAVKARSGAIVAFLENGNTRMNATARTAREYRWEDPDTHEVFEGVAWYHVKTNKARGHRIYFDIIINSMGVRRAIVFSLPEHLPE